MNISTLRAGLALALFSICLAGCAQVNGMKAGAANATFDWTGPDKRIVLVKPDVVLSELTAGGLQEPRADWTSTAYSLVTKEVEDTLSRQSIAVTPLEDLSNPHDVQLQQLHAAVGVEILQHGIGGAKLPTKGSALDWTLGPGTNDLRDRYHADYAMFMFVRDSYSSAGRKAVMFLGAIVGIGISGGTQIAYVSVVDLRTGNVVWFNTLVSSVGDLRNDKDATSFTTALLKGNPL